jgi:hypothetical protein
MRTFIVYIYTCIYSYIYIHTAHKHTHILSGGIPVAKFGNGRSLGVEDDGRTVVRHFSGGGIRIGRQGKGREREGTRKERVGRRGERRRGRERKGRAGGGNKVMCWRRGWKAEVFFFFFIP